MHVVVTGSEGFVGTALVARLLSAGLWERRIARLTLLDTGFSAAGHDERVRRIVGSITDLSVRNAAFSEHVDAVFHLASVPGGAAEKNYGLGRAINLDATLHILEHLHTQNAPPRFVFSSSIAVYGEHLPALITEDTLPSPSLSYGAQKLIGEILVADASRRGWVQGCSLRLPGVVARPGESSGLISAFMSQLFWRLAAGEPITLPVSAGGTAWWISVHACVDNLIRAATVDADVLSSARVYQMPVLRLSIAEVVAALAARFGADREHLVTYAPDPFVQAHFASYPPLQTPRAEAVGFRNDGSAAQLVGRVVQGEGSRS